MLIGYVRTSTVDQQAGLAAQKRDLENAGVEKLYTEQVSSVGTRVQLEAVLKFARDGDTLIVTKLDRLARSTAHLLTILELLDRKAVALRILDFCGGAVDTRSPTGKLMLTMFGAMAQFEREMMLERQREGIARLRGKANTRAGNQQHGRRPSRLLNCEQVGESRLRLPRNWG